MLRIVKQTVSAIGRTIQLIRAEIAAAQPHIVPALLLAVVAGVSQ